VADIWVRFITLSISVTSVIEVDAIRSAVITDVVGRASIVSAPA
jgi:hypothetical protein